jgi:hypothetical protein
MDDSLNQDLSATRATPLVVEPRRVFDEARAWTRARSAETLCACLLALMAFQMFAVIERKSITVDEIVMIPAAYYHLAAGNSQLVNEHPPLAKLLAALPLLFIQPAEIQPRQIDAPPGSPNWKWAHQERFWEDNRAAFEQISFWARAPLIALAVALGALVFLFTRELFGARAAVLAVALYSLEPTVLAHGRVVQTDAPAAFGFLLFCFMLRRYVLAPDWRRAAWVGTACGAALLAKFSMLLTGPILAATFLILLWRAPRIGHKRITFIAHALVILLAMLLVVNAAYFFDRRPLSEADVAWIKGAFPARGELALRTITLLSCLVPTDFVFGVFWQLWHNGEGHSAGLLGMYSRTGWWYYFPVAFALKTTLPFLLLSLAALAWAAHEFARKRDMRFLFLLAPFAAYTVFVMMSRIDIGVRYYLPAYTFLFITGGALLDRLLSLQRARRVGMIVAVVSLGWMGVEAARAFPDQMTYMNQLASTRPHWWHLSDSNVEWGDDVRALADYLRARGETRVRSAVLGGFLTLRYYGIENVELLVPATGPLPQTRYVAIGASFLNGSTVPGRVVEGRPLSDEERVNLFDAYRRRAPEAVFGGSIYLFRED